MKGLFITFEGGEGCGKSTLIKGLERALKQEKWSVTTTFEPGATPLGKEIREFLLSTQTDPAHLTELFLFLADRTEHIAKVIAPALERGDIVLCDRFCDSTIAYQGFARNLPVDQVRSLCHIATGGLMPDLTFVLDLDPKIGLQRARQIDSLDRFESEELSFHETIRKSFLQMAEQEPKRFRVLDALQSPEEVLSRALEEIHAFCAAHRQ